MKRTNKWMLGGLVAATLVLLSAAVVRAGCRPAAGGAPPRREEAPAETGTTGTSSPTIR